MSDILKVFSQSVQCSASSASGTRLSPNESNPVVRALTITAKNSNAGTLYVFGSGGATRSGIPLTKGQSVDFGPVPLGGHIWGEIDPSTIRVWSTAGTAQRVIFTYYK